MIASPVNTASILCAGNEPPPPSPPPSPPAPPPHPPPEPPAPPSFPPQFDFGDEPDDQSRGNVDLMWGIEADTSSTLLAYVNPYFKYSDFVVNKNFDVRSPDAQRFLHDWCMILQDSPLVHIVKRRKCIIDEFKRFVETQKYVRFPVPEENFDSLFAEFLTHSQRDAMKGGLTGFHPKDPCRVMFMGVAVRGSFKKSLGAWKMQDIYLEWTKLMRQYDQVAPKSVGKAILVSDQFVTMATQVEAIMSTAYSIWLACVLVVLVVVFCTGSLQMAVLILINLMFIVVFVIAGMSYLGLEFGGVEAVALTVLIGMSCDYCLHLSDTILATTSTSMCIRVRSAIKHLGPTIVSAAGTSLLASIPTAAFTKILILNNFGTIMCLSIISGVLFGILFFCPMCVLFGPRYVGTSWKQNVSLSLFSSPVHFVSATAFFAFLGTSVLSVEAGMWLQNNVLLAGLLAFTCIFSPLFVGIGVKPIRTFREKAVALRT
mmetsp:Transcript_1185/g.5138  ORF Transcript_1185/g.5138 Transcript_1185/m.5138 type:complete len:486 (-) Transcript_1185:114-1571(-)